MLKLSQLNYLAWTDLDGSMFLHENPIYARLGCGDIHRVVVISLQVVVISNGINTTWTDITTTQTGIKTGFSRRNMELSKSILVR